MEYLDNNATQEELEFESTPDYEFYVEQPND